MFRKPFVDDDCNDSSVCTRAPSPPAVLAELNNITAPPPKRVLMEDSAASPISDQQSQMLPPATVDTAQQHTKVQVSGILSNVVRKCSLFEREMADQVKKVSRADELHPAAPSSRPLNIVTADTMWILMEFVICWFHIPRRSVIHDYRYISVSASDTRGSAHLWDRW